MNLLLDTAAFLWLCAGAKQLSPVAAAALGDPVNSVGVSPVTPGKLESKSPRAN